MEVIAARDLNTLYIIIDILFLTVFAGILIYAKRYMAVIVGLLAGVLYFIVDYGYFYLLLGTRQVSGADPALFLLWLSMSYGFTNFAWIWLWLDNDGKKLEWSLLIMSGWLCTGLFSQSFGQGFSQISISRGTGAYHGIMALLLFIGYAIVCVCNIKRGPEMPKIPVLSLLTIGILVQFSWEFILLICGVRPSGFAPLIVNSLIETNMGLPYVYFIHRAVTKRRNEQLKKALPAV